ncbi:hypothetical protein BYT27DRAFT_7249929 [Phlegmacium glaucopus]|nr:hypothetical protein BYT27DRAFT_7249929 [Phlegmacium glaucopus]
MNNNSLPPTSTCEPIMISNIRLTRMPSTPQPKDKLYESAGVKFRMSERFVYKPRLNYRSAWQLYDGVTVPNEEDLIIVGNPNMRRSKLVYLLADRAEYPMLDISEIPFVTLATTRNIISAPDHIHSGQQSNNHQFTFGAQGATAPQSQMHAQAPPAIPQSQMDAQTLPAISTPSSRLASTQPKPQPQPQPQSELEIASPVAACISAITSYFNLTPQVSHTAVTVTAQKRSRETAFGEDSQDMDSNRRQCLRQVIGGNPYRRVLTTLIYH